MDWQPIDTAPRDGRLVELTWFDGDEPQEIYPMRWDGEARNGLIPGAVGFWVLDGGGATWSEHNEDGAPTQWRPAKPSPQFA